MSNAKKPARPSLAPKHTRTSKEAQQDALDEGIAVTVDGERYEVRIGDLSPGVVRELRSITGYSFQRLGDLLSQDPDIDLVSSFVWLARRIKGEDVAHDEVAIGYDVLFDDERFDMEKAGPRKVDASDPEA